MCLTGQTHHKVTVAAGKLLNSNIDKRLDGPKVVHLAGNHAGISHHPLAVFHNEYRSSSQ